MTEAAHAIRVWQYKGPRYNTKRVASYSSMIYDVPVCPIDDRRLRRPPLEISCASWYQDRPRQYKNVPASFVRFAPDMRMLVFDSDKEGSKVSSQ
eukprot:2243615-Rhodomonas_salina.2